MKIYVWSDKTAKTTKKPTALSAIFTLTSTAMSRWRSVTKKAIMPNIP